MSTDPLGLAALTDDQLVEMARHVGAEINRRAPAVADAATAAIREEIERTKQSQEAVWAQYKWLATMAAEIGGEQRWQIHVWRASVRDETRVYLETTGNDRRGRELLKYCYWVTGSDRQPPGTLTIEQEGRDATRLDAGMVKILCQMAARTLPAGARFDCARALRTSYDTPPMPAEWLAGRARVAAAAAREEHKRSVKRAAYAEAEAAISAYISKHDLSERSQVPTEVQESIWAAREAAIEAAMSEYDTAREEAA